MNTEKRPPTLVLFPGAWGNRNLELVTWWFRAVIAHFQNRFQIVSIVYAGENLPGYIDNAKRQLKNVPDGSFAICYSLGAQVARGVAHWRPKFFRRVALISGLERIGVRARVLCIGLLFAIIPLLRMLRGKPLALTLKQIERVFFNGSHVQEEHEIAQELLVQRMHPEPSQVVRQLMLPGWRKHMGPFPCQVMAVVPRMDFFLRRASYPGEQVYKVYASGGHGLLCAATPNLNYALRRIHAWFLTY